MARRRCSSNCSRPRKRSPAECSSPALFAARAVMEPADFYNEFSPILKGLSEKRGKKNDLDQARARALLSALTANTEHHPFRHGMVGRRYVKRVSARSLARARSAVARRGRRCRVT